jgi:DNA-binding CsgD family transcriptional regulator
MPTLIKPEDTLTPMEFRVTSLLAKTGDRHKYIAKELEIANSTVKGHLWRVRMKVGCETSIALVIWFINKYPTEEAITQGYNLSCVRAYEQYRKKRRNGLGAITVK